MLLSAVWKKFTGTVNDSYLLTYCLRHTGINDFVELATRSVGNLSTQLHRGMEKNSMRYCDERHSVWCAEERRRDRLWENRADRKPWSFLISDWWTSQPLSISGIPLMPKLFYMRTLPKLNFHSVEQITRQQNLPKRNWFFFFTMAKQRIFFLNLFSYEQAMLAKTSKNTDPKASITPRKIIAKL